MLQYSTYSVISPEGCASILWKSADKAPEAAETLGITASRLKTLGLIDKIVNEPLGGAHRDPEAAAQALRKTLAEALKNLQAKKPALLVEERLERLMGYGKFKETGVKQGSDRRSGATAGHVASCLIKRFGSQRKPRLRQKGTSAWLSGGVDSVRSPRKASHRSRSDTD